jgi:RNA polymerase sigma-70 factor (ECF subfamily)
MESVQKLDNPRAFLYKSCINLAIDMKRRNRVRQGYAESLSSGEGPEEATSLGPERLAESSERLGIVSRALWNMPGKRRKLLLMSRFDGLSYAEIARQVGLSETAVRKHISKALADCQKALQVRD